jgi:hypothetical protein
MDPMDEVVGATIDGVKLDLGSGILRFVLHAVADATERYWEVFVRGITELHLERHTVDRWQGVTVARASMTTTDGRTLLHVVLTDADAGELRLNCGEVEVVEMGRVELP